MPNSKIIDRASLVALNRQNSALFLRDQPQRRRWRRLHPTVIGALKCSDGRINLPLITEIPAGIIDPFRNIGGKFRVSWPHFQLAYGEWARYADSKGRDQLLFVTYHYSKGAEHRGCRGCGYNTEAAREACFDLKRGFDDIFRPDDPTRSTHLFTIPLGIETDDDSLVIHGERGEVWNLFETKTILTEEEVFSRLADMFPHINDPAPNVLNDWTPLLVGNMRHIQEITGREIQDAEHQESILAVGRGFDWLHLANRAIIVGPWQDNLADPIHTAAEIIQDNMSKGKIPGNKVVLLTSGIYRTSGYERRMAEHKSRGLYEIAWEVLQHDFPSLLPHIEVLKTTVDMNTRRINVLD